MHDINPVKSIITVLNPLEIQQSKQILDRLPLVVCHNDLFWENLLQEPSKKRLHSIDFEFAGINYLGSDVISLVSELLIDYSSNKDSFAPEDCPSKQDIHQMLRFYLFLFENRSILRELDDSSEMVGSVLNSKEYQAFESPLLADLIKAVPLIFKLLNIFWIWRSFYILDKTESEVDYLSWSNDLIAKHDFTLDV